MSQSRERYRRLLLTGAAVVAARGTTVLSTVLIVPVLLRHLGPERFGLWTTVTGLAGVLNFADLGLGNGLVTTLARASATDDRARAQTLVSSAFFALLGLVAVAGFIGATTGWLVPWPAVFNVSGTVAVAEATPAALWFALVLLLTVPAALTQKIQLGYQEGHTGALFQGLGTLGGLVAVLAGAARGAPVPTLVVAATAGPLAGSLLNGLWQFGLRRPWLMPGLRHVATPALRELWQLGLLFFVLQAAGAFAFASDNLVVAQVLGQPEVARFSVHTQPFAWLLGLANAFLVALWPAYGNALARGDVTWVRTALVRSLWATVLVTALPGLVLALAGGPLFAMWVGASVKIDAGVLAALAVWTTVAAIGSALSMILNAAGVVRFQVVTALAMTAAVLGAKTVGAHLAGLRGAVWGTVLAYTLTSLFPTVLFVRRWLRLQGEPRPEV